MAQAYYRRTTCRSCHGVNVSPVLHLGDMALAGNFLSAQERGTEGTYPLELHFCQDCYLVQVPNVVPGEMLFRNYFYFSSAIKTLQDHFVQYAETVSSRFLSPGRSLVVEFGCNDGILLRPFRERGMRVLGVDPATNVVRALSNEHIDVVNEFFTEKVAEQILDSHGPADVIVANNVYAHIDDIHDVTRGIHKLLKQDGVFIFEAHYLGSLIGQMQYDMIYHEHLSYYSLLALQKFFEQFGMEIFDIQHIPIHAGSVRYYVRKRGHLATERIADRVRAMHDDEVSCRYDRLDTYLSYAGQVMEKRKELVGLLTDLRRAGRSVAGYGASGRANTIIQYCGLDHTWLDYMIDDAPAKQGHYTPGSHFVIKPRTVLEQSPPDYLLVFAWSFIEEIKTRCGEYLRKGGKLIAPLPEVKVLSFHDSEEQNTVETAKEKSRLP